jgi:hypothetical protein
MTEKIPSDDVAIRRKIRLIEKHTNELKRMTPTDAGLADAVGHTRAVEVLLGETRRRWESLVAEMEPLQTWHPERRADPGERSGPPAVEGVDYSLVPQFKTTRTYNTPAILVEIGEAMEVGPTDALMEAINADAVRLQWRWTELKRFLSDIGGTMRIASKPVADYDGTDAAMVGEDRQPAGVKRVALRGTP